MARPNRAPREAAAPALVDPRRHDHRGADRGRGQSQRRVQARGRFGAGLSPGDRGACREGARPAGAHRLAGADLAAPAAAPGIAGPGTARGRWRDRRERERVDVGSKNMSRPGLCGSDRRDPGARPQVEHRPIPADSGGIEQIARHRLSSGPRKSPIRGRHVHFPQLVFRLLPDRQRLGSEMQDNFRHQWRRQHFRVCLDEMRERLRVGPVETFAAHPLSFRGSTPPIRHTSFHSSAETG